MEEDLAAIRATLTDPANRRALEKLLPMLKKARHIYVTGGRASGYMAGILANALRYLGLKTHAVEFGVGDYWDRLSMVTPEDLVIAADTIVVCRGYVLGKPADEQEACDMLGLLSGRLHEVMTGVTVLYGDRSITCTEITQVGFRDLTPGEIRRYVETGEPMDKAGSYGIQGGAALFVERIIGDYYNVVGLPVCRLGQLLKEIAPELMEEEA